MQHNTLKTPMKMYRNHCWKCGKAVGGAYDDEKARCQCCGWFICLCDACSPNCQFSENHRGIQYAEYVRKRKEELEKMRQAWEKGNISSPAGDVLKNKIRLMACMDKIDELSETERYRPGSALEAMNDASFDRLPVEKQLEIEKKAIDELIEEAKRAGLV